jgi:hypothetical protein
MPTVEMHVNAQQPPIDVLKMELAHFVVAKVSASAMNVNVIEAMEAVSVKYVLKEIYVRFQLIVQHCLLVYHAPPISTNNSL